jgi:hypothetical protein
MKFAELVFEGRGSMMGVQARHDFPNGYGVSVIRGPYTYGGKKGLYEAAVFHDESICYSTPVTGDVEGHLDEAAVEKFVNAVEALPAAAGCSHGRPDR